MKSQKNIYKLTLVLSVFVNLFLLGLLFCVLRDSFSGSGDLFLEGKSFWYFIGIIAAFSIANFIFVIRLLKDKSGSTDSQTSIEE